MNKTSINHLFFGFILIFLFSCESDDLSNEKMITSFVISGTSGIIDEETKTISVTLNDSDLTSLSPTIIISTGASINPESGALQNFSKSKIYTVTAENGSSTSYTITVTSSIYSFTHNGKKYDVIKENKTWGNAASFAVARGGYLVEINNEEEQNAIISELIDNAGINIKSTLNQFSRGAVWLGGNDTASEGTWIWDGNNDGDGIQFWNGGVNGAPVNDLYNNWGNEPDNSLDQDVLSISLENTPRNKQGEWNDLDASNTLYFVIEYN